MKKLLKPGDVLLLGLAGALDVFEDVKDPFSLMAHGSQALYGWVPSRYRRHNFSRVLARQLKTGDIEKIIKGNEVYLRLTSEGNERIVRDFPILSFAARPWDRRWRVVIFDIEEIERTVRKGLREKLRQLGLGMLQESVWVTPHDVSVDLREFLEHKGLGEAAFVLEVSAILAGDQDALVRKIWNLDEIAEAYQEIIEKAAKLRDMYVTSAGRTQQHTNEKKGGIAEEARKIRERYIETLLIDPQLPKELLPKGWPAVRAREAVHRLQKAIG